MSCQSDGHGWIFTWILHQFRAQSVHGKDETPFLLKRITELTKGQSLAASMYPTTWTLVLNVFAHPLCYPDIALVKNNAKVGARIAVELSKLKSAWTCICITFFCNHNQSYDALVSWILTMCLEYQWWGYVYLPQGQLMMHEWMKCCVHCTIRGMKPRNLSAHVFNAGIKGMVMYVYVDSSFHYLPLTLQSPASSWYPPIHLNLCTHGATCQHICNWTCMQEGKKRVIRHNIKLFLFLECLVMIQSDFLQDDVPFQV